MAIVQPNQNIGNASFSVIKAPVYVGIAKDDALNNRLFTAVVEVQRGYAAEAFVETDAEYRIATQCAQSCIPEKDVGERRLQRKRVCELPIKAISKYLAIGTLREPLVL